MGADEREEKNSLDKVGIYVQTKKCAWTRLQRFLQVQQSYVSEVGLEINTRQRIIVLQSFQG